MRERTQVRTLNAVRYVFSTGNGDFTDVYVSIMCRDCIKDAPCRVLFSSPVADEFEPCLFCTICERTATEVEHHATTVDELCSVLTEKGCEVWAQAIIDVDIQRTLAEIGDLGRAVS